MTRRLGCRLSDDPSMENIDPTEVQSLATKIRDTLPYLDDVTADKARELVYPLDTIHGVMTTGQNTTINLQDGRDAVPSVMTDCWSKANLNGYDSPYDR